MKSFRLTNDIREQILNSIVCEAKDANVRTKLEETWGVTDWNTLLDLRNKFKEHSGEVFWEMAYGGIDFSNVPHGLLNPHRGLKVCVERDSDHFMVFQMDKESCYPCLKGAVDLLVSREKYDEVLQEFNYLSGVISDVADLACELSGEAQVVLDSVNTSGQLIELWPAVEQFIPAHLADPQKGINLPALTISRLEDKIRGGE